jgi:hypothetical protein
MESMGSGTVTALGALGFYLVKLMREALILAGDVDYLFMVLASLSIAWTIARPTYMDDKPGMVVGHILAVVVATVLFYGMKVVDLSTTIGSKLGGAALVAGAAPLPTYWVDAIGQVATDMVKRAVTADPSGATLLVPMISHTVRNATADPSNLADKQAAANLSAWRLIASAAMNADSTFAAKIRAQKLTDALMNPVVPDAAYVSTKDVAAGASVKALLATLAPEASLPNLVCMNIAALSKITNEYGAGDWVPSSPDCISLGGGSVSVPIVSAVTRDGIARATSVGPFPDPKISAKATVGADTVRDLVTTNSIRTGASDFATPEQLYDSIGSGTLVSVAVQAAQDDGFKVLLGEQCQQKSAAVCKQSFSPAYASTAQAVSAQDETVTGPKLGIWETIKGGGVKVLAAMMGWLVSTVMNIFAALVAALTPFGLAMARTIAVVLSLIGIFVLLLPGRAKDGIILLIAPAAFANLWGIFFVAWWWIAERLFEWGNGLWEMPAHFGDGIAAMAAIKFVVAVGYSVLPYFAWKIVSGQVHQLSAGRGMVGALKPAAMLAMLQAYKTAGSVMQKMTGGGGGGSSTPGSPGSNPGRSTVPANDPHFDKPVPANPAKA